VVKIIIILFTASKPVKSFGLVKKCFPEKPACKKRKRPLKARGLFYQKLIINFF